MLFFVACNRMPNVPRIVMPMAFAKILAGSSSNRDKPAATCGVMVLNDVMNLTPALYSRG
jgi:hypothetical protein